MNRAEFILESFINSLETESKIAAIDPFLWKDKEE